MSVLTCQQANSNACQRAIFCRGTSLVPTLITPTAPSGFSSPSILSPTSAICHLSGEQLRKHFGQFLKSKRLNQQRAVAVTLSDIPTAVAC